VKRGEVWTAAAGGGYAGKPRPVVVVQADRFDATASITVCAFTTQAAEADVLRPAIAPSAANGLASPSRLMVDKIVTVPRAKLGRRLGRLAPSDMVRVDTAMLIFLGLADRQSA